MNLDSLRGLDIFPDQVTGLAQTVEVCIFKIGRQPPGKTGKDLKDLPAAKTTKMARLFPLIFAYSGISDRQSAKCAGSKGHLLQQEIKAPEDQNQPHSHNGKGGQSFTNDPGPQGQ